MCSGDTSDAPEFVVRIWKSLQDWKLKLTLPLRHQGWLLVNVKNGSIYTPSKSSDASHHLVFVARCPAAEVQVNGQSGSVIEHRASSNTSKKSRQGIAQAMSCLLSEASKQPACQYAREL
jgi:hypothetical protein